MSFDSNYKFVKMLGRGSEGQVDLYLNKNNQNVAVKTFFTLKSSVLHEINSLSQLKNCPFIVKILDIYIDINFKVRLVTSYHTGDLDEFINLFNFEHRLSIFDTFKVSMFDALTTLDYYGIIHNDIKPPNILVDYDNDINNTHFYLADFGLSLQLSCNVVTRDVSKLIRGSPVYMAPELLYEDYNYNEKVDIWALGLTFTEYLTRLSKDDLVITYPPDENNEDPHIDILIRILSLLSTPIYTNEPYLYTYTHDHINLSFFNLPMDIEEMLNKMLQFNKYDRASITELYKGDKCDRIRILERGEPLNEDLKLNTYKKNIYTLINWCFFKNIKLTTCYFIIDLLERYLYNFRVKDLNSLVALTISLIYLCVTFYENENVYLRDVMSYFNTEFGSSLITDVNLIKGSIVIIYRNFNYILTTCDTDEIFGILHKRKIDYQKIADIYNKSDFDFKEIFDIYSKSNIDYQQFADIYNKMDRFSGDVFNDEWIELYQSV